MLGNFYQTETEAESRMPPIVGKQDLLSTNYSLTVQPASYAVQEPPLWIGTAYTHEVSHLN